MSGVTTPRHELQWYTSSKHVLAGEITEVVDAGCYVKERDGRIVLRLFADNMTARYSPVPGDYWIIYSEGYQSISPRAAFLEGYTMMDDSPQEQTT